MALIEVQFQGNGEQIDADGTTVVNGTTWHIDADRIIPGWFGLPDTDTVIEPRTGAEGVTIPRNVSLGKRIDVALYAASNTAANAYLALSKANALFALTDGTTGLMNVTFGVEVDTLTIQRDGPMTLTPDANWGNPSDVVWKVELTVISEDTQFS